MFFRQRAADNATLSYLFGCAGIGKAVAVDVVAGDEDGFVAEAGKTILIRRWTEPPSSKA